MYATSAPASAPLTLSRELSDGFATHQLGIMDTAITTIRRRWRPRFSLRTLIVSVMLICVLLGAGMCWYREQVAEYHRQMEVAERLKANGADVKWEQQTPSCLKWAGDCKAWQRITGIECTGSADGMQVLSLVAQLPTVTSLRLHYRQYNEEVIQRIAEQRQLKYLMVISTVAYWPGTSRDQADRLLRSAEELAERLSKKLPGVSVQHKTRELF